MARSARQNEERRLRYNTILALTNNTKLAQRARDTSNVKYNEIIKDYQLPEGNLKHYMLPVNEVKVKRISKAKDAIKTVKERQEIKDIDFELLGELEYSSRKERYKLFYNVIRSAGYTPKEASKLKSKPLKYLTDLVKSNKVLDREARKDRWRRLSKKGQKLDDSMIELAEQVNIDSGYDATSRYGYSVVYAWYVNGGDIKKYIANIYPDEQFPDIYYGISKYNY